MAKFDFGEAEKVKQTKTLQKEIRGMYAKIAKNLAVEAENLSKKENISSIMKMNYLNSYVKNLNKEITKLNKSLEEAINKGMVNTAEGVVNYNIEFMGKLGLNLVGAFDTVPKEVVEIVSSGKLYKGNWKLSEAIWGAGNKVKKDVSKVVAEGIASQKSAYAIAKDLEKYVNPVAKKPWDWSKVYPNTSKVVDYNAQRLARTMIQHSYQQALRTTVKNNPFVTKMIWHSALTERTCDLCRERDEQVYEKGAEPLDHPNGLCYLEPYIKKSMKEIGDELANWVNGESNSALDKYVASAYGYKPSTKEGKKVVNAVKESSAKKVVKKMSVEDKAKFVDEKLENIKKKVIQSQNTKEQGEKIWGLLRKRLLELDDDYLRYMSTGQKKLKGIIPSNNSKAFFSPDKFTITMNFDKDLNNVKGAFTTFFHEYGHLLDHAAVLPGQKHMFSFSDEFRKSLYSSLEKEYNKLCINGVLKDSVRKDLMKSDKSNGVQDIISGLSMNKNRVKWGHSTEYWKRKGEQGVSRETMAHFSAALANPDAAAYFEKYFPESYKLLKERMLDYLKRKKV